MRGEITLPQLLETLLGDVDFLHVSKVVDVEGEVSYQGSVRQAGCTRHAESDTIDGLLQAIQGEREKPCSRCGQTKPLSQFPRRPDVGDGRASHCKVCDRERMATLYTREQRGRLVRPAPSAPAAPVA